jgi:hypothetical protein
VLTGSYVSPLVTVTAWCALSSQVDVTTVDTSVTFNTAASGSGYVGSASLTCGSDETPLSASVTHADVVDQSGPDVNNTNNWFIEVSGGVSGTANVELLCVPNSDLAGAGWVFQSWTNPSASAYATDTVDAICPFGQRMVTGGEHVDSVNAGIDSSGPTSLNDWRSEAYVPPHDTLWVSLLCTPAGNPVATITSGPPALTDSRAATFTFSAFDQAGGPVHNVCFLNNTALAACGGGLTLTGLLDGPNVFSVEALTDDGRGGRSTRKDWDFTVDATPPTVTLSKPPPFTLVNTVTLHAAGTDNQGIDHYTFNVTSQRSSSSAATPSVTDHKSATGDLSLNAVPGMSYRAAVTAYDKAGNPSVDTGATVVTAVPLDNRALSASKHWTLVKGSAYTHGVISRTTTYGATLRHTMSGNTLGLVATTCKTCGTVGVYVGNHLLKQVDLHSASTHNQRIITIPIKDNPATLQVTLKVLSHDKPVDIDGLGALIS